jgi:hypothetical protein
MVPEAKQPPAYKLALLPARESVRWRFTVRITAFGRISVQPFVSLPVEVPLEAGDAPPTCLARGDISMYTSHTRSAVVSD